MFLGYALRGMQVILLAICVWLVYAAIAPHLRAAPAPREIELNVDVAAAQPSVALEHFSVVWKRSPFVKPPPALVIRPKPVVSKVTVESKLSWKLVTTAAGSPEVSVAGLVSNKDGSRRAVRIGDRIEGRKVVEIGRGRVILSHKGKLEKLSIDKDAKTPKRSVRTRRASKRPGVRPVRPRLGKARKSAPRPPKAPPSPPSVDQLAGQFGGQLQLVAGERIVGVNGLALDDPALAKAANRGGSIVVQIQGENGVSREVVVEPGE